MIEHVSLAARGLTFPALAAGRGPLVLLLHGFPDGPETFAQQLPALAAAGYRAVAPALRGYAPEAQPADGDYHAVRMAEDVFGIADALGAERFHLAGHDWGATIAFAAAGLTPGRIASLSVIAVPQPARFAEAYVANPEQQARSAYILAFLDPAAETMIAADDFRYLETLWRSWSPAWTIPPEALAELRARFERPGVATAALSYYRQALDVASPVGVATQALLAPPCRVPTLGIAGADDGCISAEVFGTAMRAADFPAGLSVTTIADAGHFVHRERPEQVNRAILDWIARH